MAIALRKRFMGQESTIKEEVRQLGLLPAMQKHDVRDLLCWQNYIKEIMPDENPNYTSQAYSSSLKELNDNFLAAVLRRFDEDKATIQSLRDELEKLKTERHTRELQAKLNTIKLMEAVQ